MMRFSRAKSLLAGAVLLSSLAPLTAQEHKELGKMWPFEAAPLDYFEAEHGFRPTQEWLDHARLASLRYGTLERPWCSSSFISPRGLIMTNHHCARGNVKAVTPDGEDWLTTGYFAQSLAEEVQVPDLTVHQVVSMTDVTDRMNEGIPADIDEAELQAAVNANRKAILDEFKANNPEQVHELKALYKGGIYTVYSFKIYDDIRLVATPDLSAAKFGGDPDNFTYPRFSLDFTLLRAYEDGKPADTAAHFFKVKTRGPQDGETVFVTGNPGRTQRLKTIAQMEFLRDYRYPQVLMQIEMKLANLRADAEANPEKDLRNDIMQQENSQKALGGHYEGLLNEEIMDVKRGAEQRLRDAIDADPELKQRYGDVFTKIEETVAEIRRLFEEGKTLREKYGDDAQAMAAKAEELNSKLPELMRRERGLEKRVGEAFFAVYGNSAPPDATMSLRISDGVTAGYPMNGTLAPFQTTLYGLYARNTEFGNEEPFELRSIWYEKQSDLDMTTPFNWVNTCDITGGNSGSPVLNKDLEVVGLAFDGNIESLGNEFIFTDEAPRTVCVHPAIIVEALRKVYDANAIADEFEGTGPGYE